MFSILCRPNVKIEHLIQASPIFKTQIEAYPFDTQEVLEQAEILIKYDGYITREKEVAEKIERLDYVKIPDDVDYSRFSTLSNESREKLNAIRPATIGQASRISGIKPSDISIILIFLGR